MKSHTSNEIKEVMLECLRDFTEENQELIGMDVNERTLTAGLHCYLKQHLELNGWDIDCEYNRNGSGNTKQGPENYIFPDIIK